MAVLHVWLLCALLLLVPIVHADECDAHLSDCSSCLHTAGCGWCTVGGFKFCVDKSSGFCREDEWATTCDAHHVSPVVARASESSVCQALEATKLCKTLAMIDCAPRISTDCVACVLTTSGATCESLVSLIVGTTNPTFDDYGGAATRWARAGLGSGYYNYYDTYAPTYTYSPYTTVPTYTTTPPETSTSPPETSTAPPETSTAPPETSTSPPETSTAPPETSTAPPETSTAPPATSTAPPDTSTVPPDTTPVSTNPLTTTPAPSGTFITSPPAPVASCATRFVGVAAANFIKAYVDSLLKITVALDGIADDPSLAITCKSDFCDLLQVEFNLWMTEVCSRLPGGCNDEYKLCVTINCNVLVADWDVASSKKRQQRQLTDGENDFAGTFGFGNFTDNVMLQFAALFENGGAGLLGPLKGKVTGVSVARPAQQTGKKTKGDINAGELALIISIVAAFIVVSCIVIGVLLYRRSQQGKAPFAASQASGPQR